MTEQEFKRCLPVSLKGSLDDSIREQLNKCLEDPYTRETMAQNLMGYTSILSQGRFKLSSYINAVRYVTYKAMGDNNIQAYQKVFPERITDWKNQCLPANEINAYVSAFNRSKLVTLVYQSLAIPTAILNQDVFQEAINVQRNIMLDPSVKPMVRSQAAKALMDCLKPEEVKQMELSVAVKESNTIEELRKVTLELAKNQLAAIKEGGAHLNDIIDSTLIEVPNEQ